MGSSNSKTTGCAFRKQESAHQKCVLLTEEVQKLHEELALASIEIETLNKEKNDLLEQKVTLEKVREEHQAELSIFEGNMKEVFITMEEADKHTAEIHKRVDDLNTAHRASMREAEVRHRGEMDKMKAAYLFSLKALASAKIKTVNSGNNNLLVEQRAVLEKIQDDLQAKLSVLEERMKEFNGCVKEAVKAIVMEEAAKNRAELQKNMDDLNATHQASKREAEERHGEVLEKMKAAYYLSMKEVYDGKHQKIEKTYNSSLADVEQNIQRARDLNEKKKSETN